MQIQQPKMPLSSAYLNLLQSRPVAPVPRVADREGRGDAASAAARTTGAAAPPPMRGRLVNILA
jgi:hypothetical protein